MLPLNATLVSLILLLATTLPVFAEAALFTPIGFLPGIGANSKAWSVSPDGAVVVGESKVIGSSSQAFRWTELTGIQLLEDLPGGSGWSTAKAVTNGGLTIVGYGTSDTGRLASLWQNDTISDLGVYESTGGSLSYSTTATAVAADGAIVTAMNSSEAFLWTSQQGLMLLEGLSASASKIEALGISQNGTVAVGQSESSLSGTNFEAMYWDLADLSPHPLGDLPGSDFSSVATATNADGSVIVGQGTSELGREAFRWSVGTGMQALDDLPGTVYDSKAFAVSSDGNTIVGKGKTAAGNTAFIWTSQLGMRSLQEVLAQEYDISLTGWQLTQATSISSDGLTIVGIGSNPDGLTEAWVVKLPPTQLLPGDTNGDDRVDELDLQRVLQNYGNTASEGFAEGDFNQDDITNLQDLLILKQYFGQSGTSGPIAVPEPHSMLIFVASIILLLAFRCPKSIF